MRVEISPLNLSGHGGPCCVINGVKIATVCLESPHLPPNALRSRPTAGGQGEGRGSGRGCGEGRGCAGGRGRRHRNDSATHLPHAQPYYPDTRDAKTNKFFLKKMRQEMATHCSAEHLA